MAQQGEEPGRFRLSLPLLVRCRRQHRVDAQGIQASSSSTSSSSSSRGTLKEREPIIRGKIRWPHQRVS